MITNSGTITATGEAISAHGDGAIITNSGSISTTGFEAHGIFMGGDPGNTAGGGPGGNGATISSSGSISTTGDDSDGIFVSGDNAMITISGSISTAGASSKGLAATGDNAMVTISGSISTTGAGAHGVYAVGGRRAEINIIGSVSATGEDSYAVLGSGTADQTLTLSPGAQIIGRITLGESEGDNDVLIINTYTGPSLTYAASGVEVATAKGAPVVIGSDIVAVIDPTGASATRIALGATTGQIHRQVSQRLTFTPAPQVTQGADADREGRGWGTFFGSRSERDNDGAALAWKHSFYGLVGGYDAHMDSGQRVGVFAGFGQGEIRTSEVTSITDTATRGFVGVYGQHVIGNLTLDGSLMFGHASHKSSRTVLDNIAGSETANGSYNSTFISPSLSLTWAQALPNGLELRPSAQVSYTYGSYDGYTETGTTSSNVTFGKRQVRNFDGRLQLALAQPFAENRGEIEWRAGVTSAHYGNNSASAQLGSGDAKSYAVPGDRSLFGGFVGATLHYAIEDRVSLTSSVEYARTSGSDGALSGQLGLVLKF